VSEIEKLRALLAEARKFVAQCVPQAISYAQWSRGEHAADVLCSQIDAALAEPVKPSESEYAMHARIRADYDKTVADCWRAKVAEVERERDEARAEVERLTQRVRELEHPKSYLPPGPERADAVWAANHIAAFKRGAEAMREAAAQDCIELWGKGHLTGTLQAERIRALPIPEDKR